MVFFYLLEAYKIPTGEQLTMSTLYCNVNRNVWSCNVSNCLCLNVGCVDFHFENRLLLVPLTGLVNSPFRFSQIGLDFGVSGGCGRGYLKDSK